MSRLTELIKYHEQHIEDLAESYGIATEHMEMGEVKEYAGHCQRQEETLTYLKELQHYKDLEEQGRLIELPCDRVYRIMNWDSPKSAFVDSIPIEMIPIYDLKNIDNGKWLFSTKEEAEAKLAELKGTEE